jgi:hypothetical protein
MPARFDVAEDRMKIAFLVLSTLVITACASVPASPPSASANQEGLVCTKSTPTGSFLPEQRCTTAEERAAARRQQDVLIDARNERDSGIR